MLPLAYFGAALLLVVTLVPTALRPPDTRPNESAAPESGRPVVTGGTATGEVGVPVPALVRKPSRGRCFGNPPRQTESIYSAPCRAAFSGDNGGVTSHNVTRDAVRVGLWHGLVSVPEGDISDDAPDNESPAQRTMRVLQRYFNENYEFSGRRQLVAIAGGSNNQEHSA